MSFYILDDLVHNQSKDWSQEQITQASYMIQQHVQLGNFFLINRMLIKINESASSTCRVSLLSTCFSFREKLSYYSELVKESRIALNKTHLQGEALLKGLF